MSKLYKHGDRLEFRCPGCGDVHSIPIGAGWAWNGSVDAPTFRPSIRVQCGHYCESWKQGDHCWCTYKQEHPEKDVSFSCYHCHSFVTDGKIKFEMDSSHQFKGQFLEIPDWIDQ